MAEIQRIGVFTSGGDAPGMNAAIRAVVRNGIHSGVEVCGIYRGYQGMIENDIKLLTPRSVAHILQRGGTVLKSARSEEFRTKEGRKKAYDNLLEWDIDAVVAIGGDGTFAGARAFYGEFNIPFIGIPGTIDNDLYGTDFTIGFDTAVNTVVESVDKIRDTALSHNRLFFIEVMGRDSGFIATHAGIASGAVAIMIPEREMTIDELIQRLDEGRKSKKLSSIVIVAEGGKSGDASDIAKKVKERYPYYETKVTILGHVQRGGSPTATDRNLSSYLGFAAVDKLLEGHKDTMVGMVNNEIVLTSFEEAVSRKLELDERLLRMARVLST